MESTKTKVDGLTALMAEQQANRLLRIQECLNKALVSPHVALKDRRIREALLELTAYCTSLNTEQMAAQKDGK